MTRGGRLPGTDGFLYLLTDPLERDAERLERLRGDALVHAQHPQEEVLGTDVVMVEKSRLFLGEDYGSAGLARKQIHPPTRGKRSVGVKVGG